MLGGTTPGHVLRGYPPGHVLRGYPPWYYLPTMVYTYQGTPYLPTMVPGRDTWAILPYPPWYQGMYTPVYASHTTLGIPRCTYPTLYMLSAVGTGTRCASDEALGSTREIPMGESLSGPSRLLRCERS